MVSANNAKPWTAKRAVDVANDVNRWLDQYRVNTPNGMAWGRAEEDPDRVVRTLYAGSAGIVLFQLELHKATNSPEALATAIACGKDLVAYVQTKDTLPCAMFTGWPGYAFVFAELYRHTGDATFANSATFCLQRLADQSEELGNGRGWIEPMPFGDITGFTGDREIYDASVGAAKEGVAQFYPDTSQ